MRKSNEYIQKNQREFDNVLRRCFQIFEICFITYRMNFDQMRYAQQMIINNVVDR